MVFDTSVLEPVDLPPKQPYDTVPYQLDFSDLVESTDSIETVDEVLVYLASDDPEDPTDIPAMHQESASSSGAVAQQFVEGGTTATWYVLRFRVTFVSGMKLEREGRFYVLNR